jgi:hypothetical protein
MAKCYVCGAGPEDGTTVYRQNEKGQVGIWACGKHRRDTPDPVVEEIVQIIEQGQGGSR